MNVLGISGSPRKKGDTTYAVKYALEYLLLFFKLRLLPNEIVCFFSLY